MTIRLELVYAALLVLLFAGTFVALAEATNVNFTMSPGQDEVVRKYSFRHPIT